MIQLFTFLCILLQVHFSLQFQWYCNKNEDCTVANSYCSDEGLCVCRDQKIFNTDATECITLATIPSYACIDDRQCVEWMKGPSECQNGHCRCKNGHRYLNEKCVAISEWNEQCNTDQDCFDGVDMSAMVCKDKRCSCNAGYYQRGNYNCRPSGKVTGICFFDIDCFPEAPYCDFGYGPTGKCVKVKPTATPLKQDTKEEVNETVADFDINCAKDDDCSAVKNSYCPKYTRKCACNKLHVYNGATSSCVPVLGSACKDKCELPNSICKNGICQCEGFYIPGYLNEKCYKPTRNLEYSCVSDMNCQALGKYTICSNKMCVCDAKTKFTTEFMLCLPSDEYKPECTTDKDCIYKEHSQCDKEANKCICSPGYRAEDDRCLSDIGSECSTTNDCSIENVECTNQMCQCIKGFIEEDPIHCIKTIKNITEKCVIDNQCKELLGEGGTCNQSHCICKSSYVLQNNKRCLLKKYIGDECTSLEQCQVILNDHHVVCRNGFCSCDYGYMTKENKIGCQSGASALLNTMYGAIFIVSLNILYFN